MRFITICLWCLILVVLLYRCNQTQLQFQTAHSVIGQQSRYVSSQMSTHIVLKHFTFNTRRTQFVALKSKSTMFSFYFINPFVTGICGNVSICPWRTPFKVNHSHEQVTTFLLRRLVLLWHINTFDDNKKTTFVLECMWRCQDVYRLPEVGTWRTRDCRSSPCWWRGSCSPSLRACSSACSAAAAERWDM